jgi:hypothetical protein
VVDHYNRRSVNPNIYLLQSILTSLGLPNCFVEDLNEKGPNYSGPSHTNPLLYRSTIV